MHGGATPPALCLFEKGQTMGLMMARRRIEERRKVEDKARAKAEAHEANHLEVKKAETKAKKKAVTDGTVNDGAK